jgi:hypothetical protein
MSIYHYCEIFIKSQSPWILRMETKKRWTRHDIIIEALQRGYLTYNEADCAGLLYKHQSNSLPKSIIPLDKSPYKRRVENRYGLVAV